jgi:UDP-N-acetylglucosamine 2-epimerase
MKTRKSRRFYVLESIDELLSAMQEVFDVVSQMEEVHLIFRIHPGDAITKAEIYSLLDVPANVSVSDSGTFEDVLAAAHLLVSFSSTAVQEALVNHIPVLLYDKWNRYNHLDADRVENPVPAKVASAYYIDKKENLATSIPWILEQHTKKEITGDIFKKYAFSNDHFKNFIEFVEKCLRN